MIASVLSTQVAASRSRLLSGSRGRRAMAKKKRDEGGGGRGREERGEDERDRHSDSITVWLGSERNAMA